MFANTENEAEIIVSEVPTHDDQQIVTNIAQHKPNPFLQVPAF